MKRLLAVAGLGLALATTAIAEDAGMAKANDIMIHDGWARASIGKAPNSAAYMTLMTHGDATDRLVAVSTPAAKTAELHTHEMEDGIARMRQVEAISIEPGKPTALEPGGLHIMLIGLNGRLEEGKTLALTLTFENAGDVTMDVPIRGIKGAQEHHGGHRHGS